MRINNIVDRFHPKSIERKKESTIATLGAIKYALRAEAIAIAILSIKEPSPLSFALLPLAYLNYEWSMIADNWQDVLKKNSTFLSVMSDQNEYKNHLFQYAPLHRAIYESAQS